MPVCCESAGYVSFVFFIQSTPSNGKRALIWKKSSHALHLTIYQLPRTRAACHFDSVQPPLARPASIPSILHLRLWNSFYFADPLFHSSFLSHRLCASLSPFHSFDILNIHSLLSFFEYFLGRCYSALCLTWPGSGLHLFPAFPQSEPCLSAPSSTTTFPLSSVAGQIRRRRTSAVSSANYSRLSKHSLWSRSIFFTPLPCVLSWTIPTTSPMKIFFAFLHQYLIYLWIHC